MFDLIYQQDRDRVAGKARAAYRSGEVLDISYRMRHKDGRLIWIHLNGRRLGPLSDHARFYCVLTGMSAEARLFQNIANETADGIYLIDKNNYDLLYANESKNLFVRDADPMGKKCYKVLHGKDSPCEFCTLMSHEMEGKEHRMEIGGMDRFYTTRFRETDWNGIPAFIKYVRDVTDDVHNRREKERLELYFKNIVKNLPGGVMVIRCDPDGRILPEYISDGFASMTHMTLEEVKALYGNDAFAGIVPEDAVQIRQLLSDYLEKGSGHCELSSRLRRGGGGYVWVKGTFSLLKSEDGIRRLYSVYSDIGRAVEEKEQLRRQYEDLIIQHYRTPGPDEMILGHCNITQNRMFEIIDQTNSELLETFGSVREEFREQFRLETLQKRLEEKPSGYDFVFLYDSDQGVRYKQVNVLWGDQNHRTICLVRADVTDILAAERQSKEALEKALMLAEEANRAKSEFLSAMSHDIRTPMNAVIGMTALAAAHLDDRDRVDDCLRKISISSKHLLSLINDVLDMNKIERSKITLNCVRTSVSGLLRQLCSMMEPQAKEAGVSFRIQTGTLSHEAIYADALRVNQILINLLSNAIKFTPKGGSVEVLAQG